MDDPILAALMSIGGGGGGVGAGGGRPSGGGGAGGEGGANVALALAPGKVIPAGYKACSKCKEIKLSAANFWKDPTKKNGYTSWCKQCFNKCAEKRKAEGPVHVTDRECSICHQRKPADAFMKDARRITGLDARCRECRRAQHAARKRRNIEQGLQMWEQKECKRCHVVKPAAMFKKHAYTASGLDSWCKACCSERRKELLAQKALDHVNHPTAQDLQPCVQCGRAQGTSDFAKDCAQPTGLAVRCKVCEKQARQQQQQQALQLADSDDGDDGDELHEKQQQQRHERCAAQDEVLRQQQQRGATSRAAAACAALPSVYPRTKAGVAALQAPPSAGSSVAAGGSLAGPAAGSYSLHGGGALLPPMPVLAPLAAAQDADLTLDALLGGGDGGGHPGTSTDSGSFGGSGGSGGQFVDGLVHHGGLPSNLAAAAVAAGHAGSLFGALGIESMDALAALAAHPVSSGASGGGGSVPARWGLVSSEGPQPPAPAGVTPAPMPGGAGSGSAVHAMWMNALGGSATAGPPSAVSPELRQLLGLPPPGINHPSAANAFLGPHPATATSAFLLHAPAGHNGNATQLPPGAAVAAVGQGQAAMTTAATAAATAAAAAVAAASTAASLLGLGTTRTPSAFLTGADPELMATLVGMRQESAPSFLSPHYLEELLHGGDGNGVEGGGLAGLPGGCLVALLPDADTADALASSHPTLPPAGAAASAPRAGGRRLESLLLGGGSGSVGVGVVPVDASRMHTDSLGSIRGESLRGLLDAARGESLFGLVPSAQRISMLLGGGGGGPALGGAASPMRLDSPYALCAPAAAQLAQPAGSNNCTGGQGGASAAAAAAAAVASRLSHVSTAQQQQQQVLGQPVVASPTRIESLLQGLHTDVGATSTASGDDNVPLPPLVAGVRLMSTDPPPCATHAAHTMPLAGADATQVQPAGASPLLPQPPRRQQQGGEAHSESLFAGVDLEGAMSLAAAEMVAVLTADMGSLETASAVAAAAARLGGAGGRV